MRQAAAAGKNFAPLEQDVVNVAGGFRADFQAGVLRADDAIVDVDVGARAEVVGLPRGFDDDGVVAAGQMAVADFHVLAMVGINAVAIRHVEPVVDGDVVHENMDAAEHVQSPERRVAKRDVAHDEIGAAGEHEHFGPPFLEQPPFVGRVVAGHERQRAAGNFSAAGDAQIRRVRRGDDAVAGVIRLVGADEQLAVEVEINAAFQIQSGDQKFAAARNQNLSAVAGRRVNRALNRRRVERRAVARRAEIEDVEDFRRERRIARASASKSARAGASLRVQLFNERAKFISPATSQTLARRDVPAGPSTVSTTT